MTNKSRLDNEAIVPFVLAGRALVTVHNEKTGKHYTYKITAPGRTSKERDEAEILFVNVLTGPDNTSSYTYAGILIRKTGEYRSTAKSKFQESAPSVAGLKWVLGMSARGRLNEFPHVAVMHHNHCGKCNRVLTEPESVATGIGPICAARMLKRAA